MQIFTISITKTLTHIIIATILTLTQVACNDSSNNDISTSPTDEVRPVGWNDETHSKAATPDYDAVFPQHVVNRVDITIDAQQWQAMLDDMTDILGEFGKISQTNDEISPQGLEACEQKQNGDTCSFTIGDNTMEGICTLVMGMLVCVPEEVGPPDLDDEEVDIDLVEVNPIYKSCTVVFNGITWNHVGIRFKGNSTLKYPWEIGILKLPFKLNFDKFEDDYPEIENQRFYGFDKLTFNNNFNDNSYLREKVTGDIFREAGIPSPFNAFVRVFIDFGEGPLYFGLYTMTETPDDPMLDSQFSESGGNLYKPEGKEATFNTFSETAFVKKSNESEADWSDIQALITALHMSRENPAVWRTELEKTFNVEGFLQWLAVNSVIQNWDSYGNVPHNYYLYTDPSDERIHWIPWDNNESLKEQGNIIGDPLSLSLDEVDDKWPLIRYLIDDPEYINLYIQAVEQTIEGVFNVSRHKERLKKAHDLIEPYVVGNEGELAGYTFIMDPQIFESEYEYLQQHVSDRLKAATEFLSANQ